MILTDEIKQKIIKYINESSSIKELFRLIEIKYNTNTRLYKSIRKFLIEYYGGKLPNRLNGSISKIALVNKQTLQEYYDKSSSVSDILKIFNLRNVGGNIKTLKNISNDIGISYDLFNKNKAIKNKNKKRVSNINSLPYEEIMNKDRVTIKKYIIYNRLIEYKCNGCGNLGYHNGKVLVLQLDHINGINNDNRLINLRFLCPNCHSQTETFSGKNVKKNIIVRYCECGLPISKNSNNVKCTKCLREENFKKFTKFNISKEKLSELINKIPMTEIAKLYGVSDNAIKKRCKKFGIIFENRRGYWTKHKSIATNLS